MSQKGQYDVSKELNGTLSNDSTETVKPTTEATQRNDSCKKMMDNYHYTCDHVLKFLPSILDKLDVLITESKKSNELP
ncbi:hypothetical protein Bhyg_07824 [Pseudolycoriella hygida]|uniref:Uncharacterized protein n=1 Tax=Pseudolycoriella hygida TaxID=35572 RepID=A0A9Q0S3Q8_9DIPT|nr:hypothetical protein Bhyg_07824 [Pseudolycoriella hygida]